jgi:hypothetical protein
MNYKLSRRNRSLPNLNYYPKFCLDKSKNTLRSINQSVLLPRFKEQLLEYKPETLVKLPLLRLSCSCA